MAAPTIRHDQHDRARLDAGLLKLTFVLLCGGVAALLDATIVYVALHALGADLRTTVDTVQWVSTAYLLAMAAAIPLTGWSTGRWGAKRMWLIALGLFLVGSVLCGLAWNVAALIAFRAVQGVGAGLMFPILQATLVRAAGPDRVGRLLTVVTLVTVIAPVLGPVVGGLIITELSWRWIFFVNVPLCVAGLILAWRVMPATSPTVRRRLDAVGLLILVPGLAALIIGVAQLGLRGGVDHPEVLVPLIAGAVLLTGFVAYAARRTAPLVDVRLFRVRSFAASNALLFLSGFCLYGAMLLLPLYLQNVRGASPLSAGLLLAAQGLGALLSRWTGALLERVATRTVAVAGFAVALIGTVPFAGLSGDTNIVLLVISLVVRGAGLSAATIAMMAGAYTGIAVRQIPDASSIVRISQQLGAALGTAVLAVILQHQLLLPPIAGPTDDARAYSVTFAWTLGFTAVAVVVACLLPGRTPRSRRPSVPSGREKEVTHGDVQPETC